MSIIALLNQNAAGVAHRANFIGARVTLSNGVREVRRIYDHLTQEFGFEGG